MSYDFKLEKQEPPLPQDIQIIEKILKTLFNKKCNDEKSIQLFVLVSISLFCKQRRLKCYISGGYIRDKYLGLSIKHADIDFNVSENLDEIIQLVCLLSQTYCDPEISRAGDIKPLLRYHVYKKGTLTCPEVPEGFDASQLAPDESIEESLNRRDFTINAVAFDITPELSTSNLDEYGQEVLRIIYDLIYSKKLKKEFKKYLRYPNNIDKEIVEQDLINKCLRFIDIRWSVTEGMLVGRAIKFLERYHHVLNEFTMDCESVMALKEIGTRMRYSFRSDYERFDSDSELIKLKWNKEFRELWKALYSYRELCYDEVDKDLFNLKNSGEDLHTEEPTLKNFKEYIKNTLKITNKKLIKETWDLGFEDIKEALFTYYHTEGNMSEFNEFVTFMYGYLNENYPQKYPHMDIKYFGELEVRKIFKKQIFDKMHLTPKNIIKTQSKVRHYVINALKGEGRDSKPTLNLFNSHDARIYKLFKQYLTIISNINVFFPITNINDRFFNINNLKRLKLLNHNAKKEYSNYNLSPPGRNHLAATRLVALLSSHYFNKTQEDIPSLEKISDELTSKQDQDITHIVYAQLHILIAYQTFFGRIDASGNKTRLERLYEIIPETTDWKLNVILVKRIYQSAETFNGTRFLKAFGDHKINNASNIIANRSTSHWY